MALPHNDLVALRAEYLALADKAAEIKARQDAIKAKIRTDLPLGHYTPANGSVNVSPNRKFDDETARKVLPPELLALVLVEVPAQVIVDKDKARRVLAPTVYAMCMKEVGDPRVTIA